MTTKSLMSAAGWIFFLSGAAMLFAPGETGRLLGLRSENTLIVQLCSAGYIAIGVLNRMGRKAVYGGIYGRPVIDANFAFGFISVILLGKHQFREPAGFLSGLSFCSSFDTPRLSPG